MKRIDPREIDGLGEPGSAAVAAGAVDYDGQQLDTVLDDLTVAAASALVPLTATTTSGPELVWDDDDNLMMVEAPR